MECSLAPALSDARTDRDRKPASQSVPVPLRSDVDLELQELGERMTDEATRGMRLCAAAPLLRLCSVLLFLWLSQGAPGDDR